MTDKATVEAVARVIAQERPWRIRRGRYAHAAKNWSQMTDDEIRAACFLAQAAITAYEAAKEAAIEKAGDAFERGGWQEGMTPYELIPNDEGDIDGAEFAADCVYS